MKHPFTYTSTLFLLLFTVVLFTGCGSDDEEEAAPAPDPTVVGTWQAITEEQKNCDSEFSIVFDCPKECFTIIFDEDNNFDLVKTGENAFTNKGKYVADSDKFQLCDEQGAGCEDYHMELTQERLTLSFTDSGDTDCDYIAIFEKLN